MAIPAPELDVEQQRSAGMHQATVSVNQQTPMAEDEAAQYVPGSLQVSETASPSQRT